MLSWVRWMWGNTYQVISDIANFVKLVFNLEWDISGHAEGDAGRERSSFAKVDKVFDGEGHGDSLLQFDCGSIILLLSLSNTYEPPPWIPGNYPYNLHYQSCCLPWEWHNPWQFHPRCQTWYLPWYIRWSLLDDQVSMMEEGWWCM